MLRQTSLPSSHCPLCLNGRCDVQGGLPPGIGGPRDERQRALADADALLNRVAAGGGSWDAVRPPLADLYRAAGLLDLAGFVAG